MLRNTYDVFAAFLNYLVRYHHNDERCHWEESNEPDNHIYAAIKVLSDANIMTRDQVARSDVLRAELGLLLSYSFVYLDTSDRTENHVAIDHLGQLLFQNIMMVTTYLRDNLLQMDIEDSARALGAAIEGGDPQEITDRWLRQKELLAIG